MVVGFRWRWSICARPCGRVAAWQHPPATARGLCRVGPLAAGADADGDGSRGPPLCLAPTAASTARRRRRPAPAVGHTAASASAALPASIACAKSPPRPTFVATRPLLRQPPKRNRLDVRPEPACESLVVQRPRALARRDEARALHKLARPGPVCPIQVTGRGLAQRLAGFPASGNAPRPRGVPKLRHAARTANVRRIPDICWRATDRGSSSVAREVDDEIGR